MKSREERMVAPIGDKVEIKENYGVVKGEERESRILICPIEYLMMSSLYIANEISALMENLCIVHSIYSTDKINNHPLY